MRSRVALALGLSLAACSNAGDTAPADEAAGAVATPAAAPSAIDPSLASLVIAPLREGDGMEVADHMSNVGGCSFHDEQGTLLLAVGIPDNYDLPEGAGGPAIGVARPDGKLTRLVADRADAGYVERGPALRGDGIRLLVRRGEGEGKSVDRETLEWPARLVLEDEQDNRQRYALGTWRCGV